MGARPAPEGREVGVRVLLAEASSLTAREHLSVLGPAGIGVDVASRALWRLRGWAGGAGHGQTTSGRQTAGWLTDNEQGMRACRR